MEETNSKLELVLKISAFSVLLARGIQHIFFDVPYRSILWSEEFLGPIFKLMNWDWQSYVSSSSVDSFINGSMASVGVGLVVCSLVAICSLKKISKVLIASSFYLMILSFLYFVEKFFIVAQFIEYGAQVLAPFAIYYFWKNGNSKRLNLIIRIAIALTFIGHGSYAVGIFPTPGNFIDMVISILHCNETTARYFLLLMGCLDFIAAIVLFVPAIKDWAFGFCFFWGCLTTLARIMESNYFGMSHVLLSSGHEFLMRVPHFLLPLYLILDRRK
jgi:hypothetical protein